MNNLLLSWASGQAFCHLPEFRVYLESIKTSGMTKNTDIVFFTHDMDEQSKRLIVQEYGYRLLEVSDPSLRYVNRDRFRHYWNFLVDCEDNYQYVLHTDSKDVYFQSNPFDYLSYFESKVLLVPEGMNHEDSRWNLMDQYKSQNALYSYKINPREWPVINSGTIGGSYQEMKNLFFLLWTNSLHVLDATQPKDFVRPCCTDQAVMNYLYHGYLYKDKTYKLLSLQNTFCAVGEAVDRDFVKPEPTFDGSCLLHANGEKFKIFHQWERTKYRNQIFDKMLGYIPGSE